MLRTFLLTSLIALTAVLIGCGGIRGGDPESVYLIIDISGGTKALHYPVTKSAIAPADLNSDLYKTDRIVLRRIPAGTFMMGSLDRQSGRLDGPENLHQVMLTQDFYLGVFEVTQRQWMNVMGESNNRSEYKGDTHPVEGVSWDMVRGGTWNGSNRGKPGEYSFFGLLSTHTGLSFDLPTEAQWEYAARAGTTSSFDPEQTPAKAINSYANLREIKSYRLGQGYGQHTVAGSHSSNAFGMFDMTGNVYEWCLDWYHESAEATLLVDPAGPSSGPGRVVRGGGGYIDAQGAASAFRGRSSPHGAHYRIGFRIAAPVQSDSLPQGNQSAPRLVR